MKTVLTVILTIVVLCAVSFVYIYSGGYDIAASKPHSSLTRRILGLTMGKSVARRARGIHAPDLTDPALIQFGGRHYQEMCVECHGAPGVPRSEMGNDLYPRGPELVRTVKEWSPEELYWITKNGIKMTGMPAWGLTTDDHELWALVAFMKQLPTMSTEQYRTMAATSAGMEEHSEHKH